MRNFHTVFRRKWSESDSCLAVSNSLWLHGLYNPWSFPGQNTGVGSLSLLQGIFPTQGSNPGLPHCRQIIYQLSHKGSPRILEWVTYASSSGCSQLGNQTGVSCIAGRFFTSWTIREAHFQQWLYQFTFPITVHSVVLSLNTHQHLLFHLFDNSHSSLSYPWWLLMLNTLSCSCWPFYYVLWKNVYLISLPT